MTLKSSSSGFFWFLGKQIETKEAKRLNDCDTEAAFPPSVPGGKMKA